MTKVHQDTLYICRALWKTINGISKIQFCRHGRILFKWATIGKMSHKRFQVRISPQTWHAFMLEELEGAAANLTAPIHLRQITCLCKFLQWRHIRDKVIIKNGGQEVKVQGTSAVDKEGDPSAC